MKETIIKRETYKLKTASLINKIGDFIKLKFISKDEGLDLISEIKNTEKEIDFEIFNARVSNLLENKLTALEKLKNDPGIGVSEENIQEINSLYQELKVFLKK